MNTQDRDSHVDRFVAVAESYLNRPIQTVFELGARDCRESLQFAGLLPKAQIYAYECNPSTLPLCRANVAACRNIHLVEKAVADYEGPTEFLQTDPEKTITSWQDGNPGASSLLQATGKYPIEQYVQRPVTVLATTLSSELKNLNIHKIDLLWMDIQGAELMALDGLGNRIADVAMIHLEVGFFEIYHNQPMFAEMKEYLNRRGFLLLEFTFFGEYSGDAIFINKQVLQNLSQRITTPLRDRFEYRLRTSRRQFVIGKSKLGHVYRRIRSLSRDALPLLRGDCRTWRLQIGKTFGWLALRNVPKDSPVAVDVLILAVPKDYATLPLVIKSIKTFVKHPIGEIIIVAPDSSEVRLIAETSGCVFRDETQFLPISKQDIEYSVNGLDRSGWLFKMLLIFAGDKICANEHFLVIDADTLLIRPHVFAKDGKTLLLYSDEYHPPYFTAYRNLLGKNPPSCVSFVCHYMLFHRPKLNALRLAIEHHTGMTWYQAIIENTDRTIPSGFSEYETYGNFVLSRYPNSVWMEYWFNLSMDGSKVDLNHLPNSWSQHYRAVSFHSYNRSQPKDSDRAQVEKQ